MKLNIVLFLFFCLLSNILFQGRDLIGKEVPVCQSDVFGYSDSIDLKNIETRVKTFAKQKDYENAVVLSKTLLQKATLVFDSLYIASANRRLGFYYKKQSKLDSAFYFFNEAYKIRLKLNDRLAAAKRLLDMANIQNSLGDFSGSEVTAIDALNYPEVQKDEVILSGLYHIISVSEFEQGNYPEALKWNKRATKIAANNSWNHIIFLNTKANILRGQGNYEKSIKILKELLQDSFIKDSIEFARVQVNLGHVLFVQNGQNPKAKELLENSLIIRTKYNDISGLISSNIHLASYYLQNDFSRALDYATEALKNANKLKNPVSILEALDIIIPLKEKLNIEIGEEALLYSKVQNNLERTRQDVRRIYAITKYDNDKLIQNNLMLKADSFRKELQITIFVSAFLLTLCLMGFIVYYKNNQKKKEKIKASYRSEIRVAKKVHDELGNDIYYLMTQIDCDRDIRDETSRNRLKKMANAIYLKARDINKEYTPIDTGDSYGKQLIDMLESYQSNTTSIITKKFNEGFWKEVAAEKKIELFRILRELFTNMKKHSQSNFVSIMFTKNNQSMIVKYIDSDVSFDLKNLIKGDGLTNVEIRIHEINGTIKFDTKPNLGLIVELQFPI